MRCLPATRSHHHPLFVVCVETLTVDCVAARNLNPMQVRRSGVGLSIVLKRGAGCSPMNPTEPEKQRLSFWMTHTNLLNSGGTTVNKCEQPEVCIETDESSRCPSVKGGVCSMNCQISTTRCRVAICLFGWGPVSIRFIAGLHVFHTTC